MLVDDPEHGPVGRGSHAALTGLLPSPRASSTWTRDPTGPMAVHPWRHRARSPIEGRCLVSLGQNRRWALLARSSSDPSRASSRARAGIGDRAHLPDALTGGPSRARCASTTPSRRSRWLARAPWASMAIAVAATEGTCSPDAGEQRALRSSPPPHRSTQHPDRRVSRRGRRRESSTWSMPASVGEELFIDIARGRFQDFAGRLTATFGRPSAHTRAAAGPPDGQDERARLEAASSRCGGSRPGRAPGIITSTSRLEPASFLRDDADRTCARRSDLRHRGRSGRAQRSSLPMRRARGRESARECPAHARALRPARIAHVLAVAPDSVGPTSSRL